MISSVDSVSMTASSDALQDELEQRLAAALPKASAANLKALATLLACADAAAQPQVLPALLDEGCSPNSLLTTLIFAREIAMQARLPHIMSLSEEGRRRALQMLLSHYDCLQAELLRATENSWRTLLERSESQLLSEGQAHLITKARNRWLQSGEIELYNYYHEIPVIARVPLKGVREHGITVGRTPDLVLVLAAGEHGRFAHVRLPKSSLCLRLAVEGVHGQLVHWHDAGLLQTARENRRYMRVRCDSAIPIMLRTAADKEYPGRIVDFSASGLGIALAQPLSAQLGELLWCQTVIRDSEVATAGRLCWRRDDGEGARLGLELDVDQATQNRLHTEVARLRRQILGRLKMQGPPDCLMWPQELAAV